VGAWGRYFSIGLGGSPGSRDFFLLKVRQVAERSVQVVRCGLMLGFSGWGWRESAPSDPEDPGRRRGAAQTPRRRREHHPAPSTTDNFFGIGVGRTAELHL